VLALAGCAGGDENVAAPPQTEPTVGVQALDNVLALRSDFAADAGKTRVILLLSPT
jgi:hypothetical protein